MVIIKVVLQSKYCLLIQLNYEQHTANQTLNHIL